MGIYGGGEEKQSPGCLIATVIIAMVGSITIDLAWLWVKAHVFWGVVG